MKKTFLILSIGLLTHLGYSQKGQSFPEINVIDLNDKALAIPNDTKGKFSLIGLAFSEAAQQDLYSWSQPVFSEFHG